MRAIVEAPVYSAPDLTQAYWLVGSTEGEVGELRGMLQHMVLGAMNRAFWGRRMYRGLSSSLERNQVGFMHQVLFAHLLRLRGRPLSRTLQAATERTAPDLPRWASSVEAVLATTPQLTAGGLQGEVLGNGRVGVKVKAVDAFVDGDDLVRAGASAVATGYKLHWPANPDGPPVLVDTAAYNVYGSIGNKKFVTVHDGRTALLPTFAASTL